MSTRMMGYKLRWKRLLATVCLALLSHTTLANTSELLIISDMHLDLGKQDKMALAPTGFDHRNDLDLASFFTMTNALKQAIDSGEYKKPQAILVLGDNIHHGYLLTLKEKRETLLTVYQRQQTLFPNTPIIPVFGNNDSLKSHNGPYDWPQLNTGSIALEAGFDFPFLSRGQLCEQANTYPCLEKSDSHLGQFAIKLNPAVHLIGVNSILFSPDRTNINDEDAELALDTLEQWLALVASRGEKAILAQHIPFGIGLYDDKAFFTKQQGQRFEQLLKKYRDTVHFLLASHTHFNTFKKITNNQQLTQVELYAAGLSTSHGNAPSVKYLTINKETIVASQTLYYGIKSGKAQWQQAYRSNGYYCKSGNQNLFSCLAKVSYEKMLRKYSLNPNLTKPSIKNPKAFSYEITS